MAGTGKAGEVALARLLVTDGRQPHVQARHQCPLIDRLALGGTAGGLKGSAAGGNRFSYQRVTPEMKKPPCGGLGLRRCGGDG
jgi:hypothetical protein